MKSIWDYLEEISELLDSALDNLSPEDFTRLLNEISIILGDYD